MPSRSPVPIGDRRPLKRQLNGAFGSPDAESDETKTTDLSDISPKKRIGPPALTRTEILRQQNRQKIKEAATNNYLQKPNLGVKRTLSNSPPPGDRRNNITRMPPSMASPQSQLSTQAPFMMRQANQQNGLRRAGSERALAFVNGQGIGVDDTPQARAPEPEDFEDRRLAIGDSLPNEVLETPDDAAAALPDAPRTGAIAAEEQLIGTPLLPEGEDEPDEEPKRDTTAPIITPLVANTEQSLPQVQPQLQEQPQLQQQPVMQPPSVGMDLGAPLQRQVQPRTGMIALALHNEEDVREALREIENATKDMDTASATSSTPPLSPPYKIPPVDRVVQKSDGINVDIPPAPIVPPQTYRERGGGMLAQALGGEDPPLVPPVPIVPPQVERGGGMLAQALGHADSQRDGSGERKLTFVPKQSSRESSAESDEKQKTKEHKRHSVTQLPIGSAEKLKDIDLTKLDPSTRLLMLCKKGEWIQVENSLHNVDKKKFDLSMTDEHGFTPLLLAIKDGRIAVAERMLHLGADIQATTKDKRSIAHVAAMYGKEDVMKFVLNKKIDVTKPAGPNGQLPLHYACSRTSTNVLPVVQLLLRSTVVHDKDSRLIEDKQGALPLHHAVENNNVAVVHELLLQNGDKQVRAQTGETGDTAMHMACRNRNIAIVKLLIEHGAGANIRNAHGRTPLHEVAEVGDESLLKIMYGLKADATIVDNDDKTPLHVAAERGHTTVVELLVDKFKGSIMARTKDGSTLMHIAAFNGHSQTALAFLKRGVPMNMPNKTGALGLHCAAAMGHNEVVKTLIAKGTPVDIKTKENYTALHVAVQSGKAIVVETLLGHGADVHVQGGPLGETALHIASGLTGPDARACAEMLLKSGAEANVPQLNGETALHIAARFGRPEMIRLLLSEGADPMAASQAGETALHVAARNCHYEAAQIIVKYVEEHGGPASVKRLVNYKNMEGLTTLHYAAEIRPQQLHHPGEDAQLMNLLIDSGGDVAAQSQLTNETVMHHCARSGNEAVLLAIVNKIGPGAVQIVQNKQSKNGWSPLLEACDRGHTGVVKLLLEHHARIDVFDEFGKTGLHLAAANGHLELTDLLLRNKAFVNSKSKAGEAPLHLAAMNGHTKAVNLLVQDHGASLEAITLENQTALHFAAKYGQLAVSSALLALGANANARDNKGQTPLHLAAENDYPEVVKLFLKMKSNNRGVLTAVDDNGFTCAHIAAMKGSIAVVKELMMIDKAMVIEAKTKTTESTTLHMAAAGGHKNIVKILLENGANPEDENAHGMTALHLGAKNGFVRILEVFDKTLLRRCSRKTGLNALHIAAYYGQSDFVSEMLSYVPASCRSEPPINNHLVVKELATEYGLTPLHLAAQSGHDGLVRMLLNQGVQVDATSTTMSVIPLHLAAQQGHIAVVGMLLSRSTQQQHVKDSRGRTPLHLAAMNGHYDMVSLLIAQGSNINVMDQNGWTGMHFATKAGHLNVLRLFVKSSADPQAETKEGKIPLCFAASHGHIDCLHYLLLQDHDTHQLMEDRKFIFDLMVCGKGHTNQPLQEFILRSPAPIDTAVKLSSLYKDMSEKEKERARDLSNVSVFAENMAVELLGIAATEYNPALLLKAHDQRGRPFLDVLIENEQKEVVSYASVQRYLTEIWTGRVNWSFGKMIAFTLFVLLCPPAWFFFSLPLDNRIGRAPIIKFVCHIVSHVYFTILLTVVVLNIAYKMYNVTNIWPNPVEWVLLVWLSGNLVSELSSVGGRSGLGVVKLLILILSALAMAAHIFAFVYPMIMMSGASEADQLHFVRTMLYLKNQFFAFGLLFAFVQYLDFLTVHHLFGPWAIIIRDLMYDLARFLVILILFIAGFTLHVTSIFQPCYQPIDEDSAQLMRLASPDQTLEMLFFSMFGLVEPDNMPPLHLVPDFAKIILKVVFGIYMMVTLIVLINLLIAMMSDTYQRIQAQSDTEWKFGRAMLIRQMNKRSATPAPINMLTKFYAFLKVAWKNRFHVCTLKAQDDLRYEDNIDAYSMSGQQGRATPALKMLNTGDDNELTDNAELGHSSEWKIETVIDWRRVVAIFYQLNGRPTIGIEEVAVADAIAAEDVSIEMDGARKPAAAYGGPGDARKPG